MNRFRLRSFILAVSALCLVGTPALADTAIGAGVFLPSDGATAGGVMGSFDLTAVPVVPIKAQISAGAPLGPGGRFVATVEGELELKNFFAGVGAGGGKLREVGGETGVLYDFFIGTRLAPFISAQAKYYNGGSHPVGSAAYLGLSVGLK
ncbi:MAG TPA: hypothetical protein VGD50_01800 [Candidatus Baltobacteraceae bacterium]